MYLTRKPYIFIILMVFICIGWLAAETQYEVITDAAEHFARHEFVDGRTVLMDRLKRSDVKADEKAAIFNALGDFYCNEVGDYVQGITYYNRVLDFSPEAPQINSKVSQIRNQQEKYAHIDQILAQISSRPNWLENDSATMENVMTIKAFMAENPDYYQLARGYYCLGLDCAGRGKDLQAINYFDQANQIKPAMDFEVSIEGKMDVLHTRWLRKRITAVSSGTFTIMFILTVILFYAARPWRWMRLQQIAGSLVVIVLLCAVILGVHTLLARSYAASDTATSALSEGGYYLYTSLTDPGSQILISFMLYLAVAFCFIAIFAACATALIKNKPAAVILSAVAGTLIMASAVSRYYLKNCDTKLETVPDLSIGRLFSPSNAMAIKIHGIEPFILTEPDAFPNLHLENNVQPNLEEWARQHCPFDQTVQPGKAVE